MSFMVILSWYISLFPPWFALMFQAASQWKDTFKIILIVKTQVKVKGIQEQGKFLKLI